MKTVRLKGILIVIMLIITACAPATLPVFDTSDLAAQARAEAQVAIQATQTVIAETANAQPTYSERVQSADANNGETLFTAFQADAGFACSTCHWVDTENQLIGPGLLNVSNRAETRVQGQDATEYVYNAIVNPDNYIVEPFSADLMPENWADIYTEDEIFDLIAYLWTLNG